ncbi:MAG: tryptophan--tRNA ligase, partial [Acutalibacteraceae bacterium]
PEVCMINKYHKTFNPDEYDNICEMCRNAQIGCVACKKQLSAKLNEILSPIRERRAYYDNHRDEVREIIISGTARANEIGEQQLEKIKSAMNVNIKK